MAGAGGGTLFLLAARSLPGKYQWKNLLIFLAPSFSIACSTWLIWAKNKLAERRKRVLFDQAQRTLEIALDDKRTSAEHKEQLRKDLERLQSIRVRADLEPILEESGQ
jgi:hypothetical protein